MSHKQSPLKRREAIKELIKKKTISHQNQLVKLLIDDYDIETNQAVVSRDLRKLGMVKKLIDGVLVYDMPQVDVEMEMMKLALVDINYNESLIVIKTHPGLAAFIGDCIDQFNNIDILGCLSGENVVFVSPKSTKHIQKTYEAICKNLNFKNRPLA